MAVISSRRAREGRGVNLDQRIEEVLTESGPQDPLSLISRLRVVPGDLTARVVDLVISGTIVVEDGRFAWRGRRS